MKNPEDGGMGIRDPVITLDAAKIMMLKKLITRSRQPWMRWIEHRLTKVATDWKVEEAMAATPTRHQRLQLSDSCLTESTLKIWLEIGGQKRPSHYITTPPKPGDKHRTPITTWISGFGISRNNFWTPIEYM